MKLPPSRLMTDVWEGSCAPPTLSWCMHAHTPQTKLPYCEHRCRTGTDSLSAGAAQNGKSRLCKRPSCSPVMKHTFQAGDLFLEGLRKHSGTQLVHTSKPPRYTRWCTHTQAKRRCTQTELPAVHTHPHLVCRASNAVCKRRIVIRMPCSATSRLR
jgi:hypothetical protein